MDLNTLLTVLSVALKLFASDGADFQLNRTSHESAPKVNPISIVQHQHIISVPDYVKMVPKGHFACVSKPCAALAEARKSAVNDVIRQILGSINAEYDYRFTEKVSGNPRHVSLNRKIEERFSELSRGIVLHVEKNIVRTDNSKDQAGNTVCFILVRYPDHLIREMRRLSKGAHVVCDTIHESDRSIRMKVSETNNVSVNFSSAKIKLMQKNRFAGAISFFIWKVPPDRQEIISIPIDPFKIQGDSHEFTFPASIFHKNVSDYLLGADVTRSITLQGYDELGKEIRLTHQF